MPRETRRGEWAGAEVLVFEDRDAACEEAAEQIVRAIEQARAERGRAVIGLATGSTPIPVYDRLCAFHDAGRLSFQKVTTYNLDEYYPIAPLDPKSYRFYMHRHLFTRVDARPEQTHLPDGTTPEAFLEEQGAAYDRWIAHDGGLDLQLLGIGRNGHIGFNEPMDLPVEEALRLPTRPVELHPTTIADAAKDFGGAERVPKRAITMGTASILAARSILLIAFGASKAEVVAQSLLGPPTGAVPASLLQKAEGRVAWLLDAEAASGLPEEH